MAPKITSTPSKRRSAWRHFAMLIAFTLTLGLVPLFGQAVVPQASSVLAPTAAYASGCTNIIVKKICGSVKNDSRSKTSIKVYDGWSGGTWYVPSGKAATVKPGKSGPAKDDDGACIPLGHKGYVAVSGKGTNQTMSVAIGDKAPRCFKVTDTQNATFRVTGKSSWYTKILKKVPAKYSKAVASAKAKLVKAEKALKVAKATAKKAKTSAAKKAAKKNVSTAELKRNMARNFVAYKKLALERAKAKQKILAQAEAKHRDCVAIRAREGKNAQCV